MLPVGLRPLPEIANAISTLPPNTGVPVLGVDDAEIGNIRFRWEGWSERMPTTRASPGIWY